MASPPLGGSYRERIQLLVVLLVNMDVDIGVVRIVVVRHHPRYQEEINQSTDVYDAPGEYPYNPRSYLTKVKPMKTENTETTNNP